MGLVLGYAWSLACLFLSQVTLPSPMLVLPSWLAGLGAIGAIGGAAALVIGGGMGRRSARRAQRRRPGRAVAPAGAGWPGP